MEARGLSGDGTKLSFGQIAIASFPKAEIFFNDENGEI